MSTTISPVHQLESAIRIFIADTFILGQPVHQLGNHQSLLDTGVIDSTGILELIAYLEEAYEIQIPDEEIVPENLDSISKIAHYVCQKRVQK